MYFLKENPFSIFAFLQTIVLMKNYILIITLLFTAQSFSQTTLISNNPDDIQKITVWGGVFLGPTAISWGGISFILPKYFSVKTHFMTEGFNAEGTLIFFNTLQSKKSTMALDVKAGNAQNDYTDTVYRTYIDYLPKRRSFGLHFGGGSTNYSLRINMKSENTFVGFSLVTTRFGQVNTIRHRYTKKRKKYKSFKISHKSSFNIDYLKFHNHRLKYPKDYDNAYKLDKFNETQRRFGWRVYFEGHLGSGVLGLHYLLGYSQHADSGNIKAIFGIGISFSFIESGKKTILYKKQKLFK